MKIIVDSREQNPWQFPADVIPVRGTLAFGDYAIKGLQHVAAVERKSVADFVGCLEASHRHRLFKENRRAVDENAKLFLVVDGTLGQVTEEIRRWFPNMSAPRVVSTFVVETGLVPLFTGGRLSAAYLALALLRKACGLK